MTKISRRNFSIALMPGMAAATGGFAGLTHAQSEAPLVLGQSAPLTGPAAQLGIQFNEGAKLWLNVHNAQPGVRRVTLKALDDGYEPERTTANTTRFLEEEVLALFGYIGTPTSMAALPLTLRDRVPFIAPFTGAMSLREPFLRNVFHLRASYNDETALIVRQLGHVGLKKIAVFHQNDAYGQAGLDGVKLALAKDKLQPVGTATVERNSEDVRAAVEALVPLKPDAIVQIGAYKACAAFVRAARKAGYGGTFHNVSFVGTQALADELGKDGAGVAVSQVMPSPYSAANGLTRDFVEAARKTGVKMQANYSSIEGFLAARVLTEGLRRVPTTGRVTRDALITALESIERQSFGGFDVSFSPRNHVASKFVELSMLTGDGRIRT